MAENRSPKGRSLWAEPRKAVWWLWLWTVSPSLVCRDPVGKRWILSTASLQIAPCTVGICETSPTCFPSWPQYSWGQLIWVAWDVRNPSDAKSPFMNTPTSTCSPATFYRVKPKTAPRIMESLLLILSSTRMLLDITQHHEFHPSDILHQQWSKRPGSSWPCRLSAATCCEDNKVQSQDARKTSCCLKPTTLWHNLP